MAEQAHQRFLRTVKMLTDLRRLAPTVFDGHAGQVNLAQQQVNVATPRSEPTPTPRIYRND